MYDAETQYKPISAEEKKKRADDELKYGNQAILPSQKVFAQKKSKRMHKRKHHKAKGHKDAYDNDVESTSPYDDAGNINQGNPYMKTYGDESVMEGPGLQEIEKSIETGLEKAHAAKEFEKSGVPTPPGEIVSIPAKEGAMEGFGGAIPYAFDKGALKQDYEAAGGPAPKFVKKAVAEEKKAAEEVAKEEEGKEQADAVAAGAVKEEMAKEAAAEAGDVPETSAPPVEGEEAPAEAPANAEDAAPAEEAPAEEPAAEEAAAALAQRPRKKHHRPTAAKKHLRRLRRHHKH